jgi:hypothetical protein
MQNDAALDAQLREASAEDPGSVDNVLRAGAAPAARPNAGFSFEHFFRVDADAAAAAPSGPASAADATTAPPPAHRGAEGAPDDDLDEFHAWLAGLSKS